ncbi:uncharacterized protein YkwD [Clostridium punense]|uniref:Uncharacterized protein YkwD n=1 Tax=Clostridium punense TaxID=1054297 RepID=A0ABS4JY69_9CLOT|nr:MULTISPECIES: CAP domain-containing protein [Clostridium]EQB89975.1 hypothetical protein M918_02535 [Clostridium sp. BL8]MBP2020480.1 uncharacterized protein YkwD [Clostridium punense]
MITNKILALILSLCTIGGATAGTVANNSQFIKLPLDSIVQKINQGNINNGQIIEIPINNQSPTDNQTGGQAPSTEAPKPEAPTNVVTKPEQPKTETPGTVTTKPEAPKPEQPATNPATSTPSGLPANPNNKSFKYLEAVEKEILTYVNQERTKAGLKPLAWEEAMRPIARYKSNNMLQYNYFEHNTPSLNNASPMDLATKYFKYNTNGYGENIFYSMGYPEATTTAKYLVDQWMNSPGHRANILNSNWTKMGAGVVFSSQGNYVYATQHFSTR